MDPINTLGTILETEQERDAIHIAIAPIIAAHSLRPGDHVGLNEQGEADNLTGKDIGIVDPFLKAPVRRGQRFWIFLYPNTVTSLRHHWFHPAFGGPQPPAQDDLRLVAESVALQCGKTYEALMNDARRFNYAEDYIMDNSERYKEVAEVDWKKFWQHFAAVTGEKVNEDRWAPYTCSC